MDTEAVGTVPAFERIIGAFPETFGMQKGSDLPQYEHDHRHHHKAAGKKAGNEDQRAEHHQVIPVENAAGGAAAVFHKELAERTPEKHTDQVTDIKQNGDPKQIQIGEKLFCMQEVHMLMTKRWRCRPHRR